MRTEFGVALLSLGLALGVVFAQEKETKSTAKPIPEQPPAYPRVDVDSVWHFHYEGKQRKGDLLQLADPEGEEGQGRTLVITQLEVRMRVTMRARLVSHHRLDTKKNGKNVWAKEIVRSELFSLGWLDGTSKYMAWNYSGWVGIPFAVGTRPSLEFRQGGGDIAVYAEGYWVRKKS